MLQTLKRAKNYLAMAQPVVSSPILGPPGSSLPKETVSQDFQPIILL
jgi:hypothetical protein